MMKTSLDIPEKELKDALRFTKSKTKREAIVTAVMEYNRRNRMASLTKYGGSSDTFMMADELMKMRKLG
jgi:hypothetical protein